LSSNFPLAGKLSDTDNSQLIKWLGAVTRVLQSTVASADFYERAAKEMVDLIGLDSGRVLEFVDGGRWTVAASYHRRGALLGPSSEWIPISSLIRRVMEEKRTIWTTPSGNITGTVGTEDVTVAVASPLLDRAGNVIGMLYGDRHTTGARLGAVIDELEALLVETLARGVSTGRARVDQERAAAEAQVRFEQFFTPELSRQLAANADLLTRRDTEVTLLFADIRRFSAISEQLGAEVTMKWLSEVMGKMADCAAAYDGTLVDYIGDELMVMWGAPAEQPDHATRACQTALDMARLVKDLDEKWQRELGHRTQLGFGVNTGSARVGNVGFARKFRYAPFGNTVNTASRVQGATKYLGADVVVTGATFQQLRGQPLSRRLCSVRVVNIEAPIMLYELCPVETAETTQLCQQYEEALGSFEKQELAHSINVLSDILRAHPKDGPTLLLLARAVEYLQHRDKPFDPVFELPGK
jgi:adenylate cyclase